MDFCAVFLLFLALKGIASWVQMVRLLDSFFSSNLTIYTHSVTTDKTSITKDTNPTAAGYKTSTLPLPKPDIGHVPRAAPSTKDPQIFLSKIHLNVILLFPSERFLH
jgi:hypothetical protein